MPHWRLSILEAVLSPQEGGREVLMGKEITALRFQTKTDKTFMFFRQGAISEEDLKRDQKNQ